MTEGGREEASTALGWRFVAIATAVVLVHAVCRTLAFPYSPEDWISLAKFRELSFWQSLLPIETYPYYRPVWSLWFVLCERLGLSGGLAHVGPALAHIGAGLALLSLLKRAGFTQLSAAFCTVLALTAPGTAGAMSWFAAGNKCFTLLFLVLASRALFLDRSRIARYSLSCLFAALAMGSAENGYLAILLLPLIVIVRGRQRGTRLRASLLEAGLYAIPLLALGLLHLSLLPQNQGAPEATRVAELVSAFRSMPIESLGAVLNNLGRYFLFGLGVAEDQGLIGAAILGLLLVTALLLQRRFASLRFLCVALFVYLVLNVPASLFPGESSRHHGYLPAVGAGLVLFALLRPLVTRLRVAVLFSSGTSLGHRALVLAALLGLGFHGTTAQGRWAEYLGRADEALNSLRSLFPKAPTEPFLLLNVPIEYRAAFPYLYGSELGIESWPTLTILTSREEYILPGEKPLPLDRPGDPRILEYDGHGFVLGSWGDFGRRKRAPAFWFDEELGSYRNSDLAWSEILSGSAALSSRALSQSHAASLAYPRGRAEEAASASAHEHGIDAQSGIVYWELDAKLDGPKWLTLGWWPSALPTTQRAGLFTLHPLPWAFRVEVLDLETGRRLEDVPVLPVYGFLPSLYLRRGQHRLRVELSLRR